MTHTIGRCTFALPPGTRAVKMQAWGAGAPAGAAGDSTTATHDVATLARDPKTDAASVRVVVNEHASTVSDAVSGRVLVSALAAVQVTATSSAPRVN
jgi:hypothetical protein